jgi:hypothetical protein
MSNVASYSEERAARGVSDLPDLDDELVGAATDEMAEALARVAPGPEPVRAPAATGMLAQWERYRPQIAEAMDGGLYTLDELEAEIARGETYFWPGANAAVVAKPVSYPNGAKAMTTLWAVGDLDEVLALAPGIEATARLVGCTLMLVEGRKGWEKLLKPQGYEPWSVTVAKVL